jgi:hypothetical protein
MSVKFQCGMLMDENIDQVFAGPDTVRESWRVWPPTRYLLSKIPLPQACLILFKTRIWPWICGWGVLTLPSRRKHTAMTVEPPRAQGQEVEDFEERQRETLRAHHGVRSLKAWEEGFALRHLPAGIFGFTYSPGLEDAPLFRKRKDHAFEVHKTPDGSIFLIAFVSEKTAARLETADRDLHLQVYPSPSGEKCTPVRIPVINVVRYKDYPPKDGSHLEIQFVPSKSLDSLLKPNRTKSSGKERRVNATVGRKRVNRSTLTASVST